MSHAKKNRHSLITRVLAILAMLCASLVTASVTARPADAAIGGKRVAVLMPFAAGGTTGNESPANHLVSSSGYGFAWDLHGGASTGVYPRATTNDGTLTMNVLTTSPSSSGAGTAVIVEVRVDGVLVGTLNYRHLVNIPSGITGGATVGTGTRLGDTAPATNYGGCYGFTCSSAWQVHTVGGIHTHVEFKQGCYGPQGLSSSVGASTGIALLSQNYGTSNKSGCDSNELNSVATVSVPPPSGPAPTRDDILMTVPNSGGNVDYMFGASIGNGTFNAGYSSIVNRVNPLFTKMADINGDGKDDIVLVEDAGSGLVNYLYGLSLGNGTFTLGYAAGLTSQPKPNHVATGDFNGDGKDDIFIGIPEPSTPGYTYYMFGVSYGNGSFGLGYTNLGSRPTPLFVDMGEFSGGGGEDLLLVEDAGSGLANYVYGVSYGNGSFGLAYTNLTYQPTPTHVMTGSFNGDSRDDILMTVPNTSGNVGYMFGISYGGNSFGLGSTNIGNRPDPLFTDMGDFNGDGSSDIIIAEDTGSGLTNYLFAVSYSNGTFGLGYTSLVGQATPTHMMIGDFNNS